jgi:hypothetical protein
MSTETAPAAAPSPAPSPSPAKSLKGAASPADIPTAGSVITAVVPQFIRTIPPKAESAGKPKEDVRSTLEKRRDKVVGQLKSTLEKGGAVDEATIDDICSKLSHELTLVTKAYLKAVTDAGAAIARLKITDAIPKEVDELGQRLPIHSNVKLEEAIAKKRNEVIETLANHVEAYHYSWYIDDESVGFNRDFDAWADLVRGERVVLGDRANDISHGVFV